MKKNYKPTQKQMNKLIAKVERYFTWESRYIEVGEKINAFDHDRKIYISVDRGNYGVYCHLKDSKRNIKISGYRNTYKEINDFITMVKLIG